MWIQTVVSKARKRKHPKGWKPRFGEVEEIKVFICQGLKKESMVKCTERALHEAVQRTREAVKGTSSGMIGRKIWVKLTE